MNDTNIHDLPQPLVSALQYDDYDAGAADISTTGAILPPRIRQLELRHRDEITEDVSDKIWKMLGGIGHKILERSDTTNHLAEERIFAKVNNWTISGQADLLGPGKPEQMSNLPWNDKLMPLKETYELHDYKFTSVWAVKDAKPEWEQQLNIYAWLYRQNGFEVKRARIIAILRDWSKLKAEREPDYPQVGVVVREVPLWTPEAQDAFVRQRLTLHELAGHVEESELPLCTDEERWHKPDSFAVRKRGKVRALRVYFSKGEAETDILERFEKGRDLYVEHRPGIDTRCQSYCRVSQWCSQWKAIKATNPQAKTEEESC